MAMIRVPSTPASIGSSHHKTPLAGPQQWLPQFMPVPAQRTSKPYSRRLAPLHHDQFEVSSTVSSPRRSTTIWRSSSPLCNAGEQSPLPPLAKGASRHRLPSWAAETRVVARATGSRPTSRALCDPDLAESYGRKILGDDPWPRRVFEAADGGHNGYLSPADWAALMCRLKAELGTSSGQFLYEFEQADTSLDGRVQMEEWELFAATMEEQFSHRRCRIAAMRYLGTRKAEARSRVKNIYMFDGFDQDASCRLLTACSKWDRPSLLDSVVSALDAKADPNAGLVDSRFNDYTPLIFLALAQPTAEGTQVALAIDTLVAARADVHRESGLMPFGRLVPLRFAARLQNERGLEALLRYVDVGDRFNWAAGENVEHVMLDELKQLFGEATRERVAARSRYSTQATVLLRLFASPIVGGKHNRGDAKQLLDGTFADGNIKLGSKADPNGPGLEGMTALMEVVKKGDFETTFELLKGRATPLQQDSSGATPLHFAAAQVLPQIARLLLEHKAEPSMVDQAGFSAWMVAGEAVEETDPSEYAELMELLKPRYKPEDLLEQIAVNGPDAVIGDGVDPEVLKRDWRLHESLFFESRVVVRGAYEGRFPRKPLLMRVKDLILDLLKSDPLVGKRKALAKYLLQATMGPTDETICRHVRTKWATRDNRQAYRRELMEAVQEMLNKFAAECNLFRAEIQRKADIERLVDFQAARQPLQCTLDENGLLPETPHPALRARSWSMIAENSPGAGSLSGHDSPDRHSSPAGYSTPGSQPRIARRTSTVPVPGSQGFSQPGSPITPVTSQQFPQFPGAGRACQALCGLPADEVIVPEGWQEEDPFWRAVQERQILRYDPLWARGIHSGASCSLQLLRLGAVADLAECSALQQVHHASMEEQIARCYVAYSEICNAPFQDLMKQVAERIAEQGFHVIPPEQLVPAKKLKRLMEKTREAREERSDLQWPNLDREYLRFSHCFYILDSVRTAFICGGDTLGEQVACCMELVREFSSCTAEEDGLCVVRRKSGFAAGVKGSGGYADVKLLIYADLGMHKAFDDAEVPRRIVGEVQIILQQYMDVKRRMHLVYEVSRGSFDRASSLVESSEGQRGKEAARRALRKLSLCRLTIGTSPKDLLERSPSQATDFGT